MKLAAVEDEYKKNNQLKSEDVKSLMKWAALQPHLPKITELEAIYFLHCTFYSNEAAKNVIDLYYTCRTHVPEFFDKRDPFGYITKYMENIIYTVCPHTTPDNHQVCYVKLTTKDVSNYNFGEMLKLCCMFLDLWLLKHGTAPGHKIILDMDMVTLSHIPKLTIMHIKKFLFYLQECIPFRLTGVHVINVVPFIDKIMMLVKPFMKKQLWDVLIFHTNGLDSLYTHFPKKCLPQHLGGDGPSIENMHAAMKRDFQDNADYFKEELEKRVDETKRPGKAKNAGDLFGVEGSFKKLDID